MKKGIRASLAGYSEYQLAKYPKGLAPLIKNTHPGPRRPEFQALIENRIEAPYTWEVELTRHGNNAETWDELLSKDAVGYMALLRNLRNILKNPSQHIDKIVDKLTSPEAIKRSKQLPFRFLSAHRALDGGILQYQISINNGIVHMNVAASQIAQYFSGGYAMMHVWLKGRCIPEVVVSARPRVSLGNPVTGSQRKSISVIQKPCCTDRLARTCAPPLPAAPGG